MKFWRKYHRWISIFITLPFLMTIVTGILLLFRGKIEWISPKMPAPVAKEITIPFSDILKAAQSVPELQVQTWNDVGRIDIRPASGAITVRSKHSDYEIGVDGSTGAVLGLAKRNSSLLVRIHESTYLGLGDIGRFGIALPMALGVLFLTVSGVVIFFQPALAKRSAKKRASV
ncbi:PepSY domain-containing protein [Bdellovibrio sp. HCB117]|uniref:PepSY domain-containing protein n=1 Tax=Bdellovibrio sp. HCB117 TaxID=3394359 RepID=UPI0039B4436F